MARNKTKKPERDRFVKEAFNLIIELGGVEVKAPHRNDLDKEMHACCAMDTKFGPLEYLSLSGNTTEGPGCCMTRFRYAVVAHNNTNCNEHSGKWNHHYFSEWTTDKALADLRRRLENVLPTTTEEFADQTSIVMQAVVETVLQERNLYHQGLCDPPYAFGCGNGLQHDESVAWFAAHAERRIRFLYDTNARIHNAIESGQGLETVYMFVDHWLDAYLDDQPNYRKQREHGLLDGQ